MHYIVLPLVLVLKQEVLAPAPLGFAFAVVVTVQPIFQGLFTFSKFDSSTVVADRSKTDAKAKRTTF